MWYQSNIRIVISLRKPFLIKCWQQYKAQFWNIALEQEADNICKHTELLPVVLISLIEISKIHQNQVSQNEISGKYNQKLNGVTRKLSKIQQVSYVQRTYNFIILESRTIHEHESTNLLVLFEFNFSCCPYCVSLF